MTYKYCLVRRAIYENDPTSKLKKRRSLKDMKRLFKLPFWIMMFLVICSLISIALILLFKFNTMLVSIPYFVIALVSFVFEIPREDKIYHMEERNKEIRIKECEYEEYINNVREILTELGVNTPNKIEKLKEECEEILIKRNNRFSNINNRIIDMLIGVPLGALIESTIYADTKTQNEGIVLILSIGLILFIIIQIAKVWQYYTDANFKDRYLLDVLNELSYYSDE